MYSIVIIEDDLKISEIQNRFVQRLPQFEVVGIANSISEGREIIEVFAPDLVLLDITFPDGNGMDLLRDIRQNNQQTDIILITAAKEVQILQDAIRGGVFDFILKPMTYTRLQSSLNKYSEHRQKLSTLIDLEQTSVDLIISPKNQNRQGHLPKGIDVLTLNKIKEEMIAVKGKAINAEKMGEKIGVSRTTARRYLEYLVLTSYLNAELEYGTVGRPERYYSLAQL